eukprot:1314282-Rhodomonas_salina.2
MVCSSTRHRVAWYTPVLGIDIYQYQASCSKIHASTRHGGTQYRASRSLKHDTTLQNQIQETALSVQIVSGMRFLAIDFPVHGASGGTVTCDLRKRVMPSCERHMGADTCAESAPGIAKRAAESMTREPLETQRKELPRAWAAC